MGSAGVMGEHHFHFQDLGPMSSIRVLHHGTPVFVSWSSLPRNW